MVGRPAIVCRRRAGFPARPCRKSEDRHIGTLCCTGEPGGIVVENRFVLSCTRWLANSYTRQHEVAIKTGDFIASDLGALLLKLPNSFSEIGCGDRITQPVAPSQPNARRSCFQKSDYEILVVPPRSELRGVWSHCGNSLSHRRERRGGRGRGAH